MTVPKSVEELHLQNLKEEADLLTNTILNGSCKTFEEYRWYTGQLQGLRLARAHFVDVVDRWKNE
jgi:hypothetical protein